MRTRLFGNLEYTKHGDTDGVGIQFFYWLWLLDLKPEAWSLCSSNLLGFFNQGAPKRHRKVPTINAQSLSKEAKQNSIKRKLFWLPPRYLHCSDGHLQDHTSQDHFCSVINEFPVWNSKSFKPRWWDTVPHPEREADRKLQCFWSLMIAHCSVMSSDGWGIVWVALPFMNHERCWACIYIWVQHV